VAANRDIRGRFVATLVDQVSPAAKSIGGSLGGVGAALQKSGQSFNLLASSMGDATQLAGAFSPKLGELAQSLQNPELAAVKLAAAFWEAVGAMLAFAAATASDKIAQLGNLEAILGSAKAASELADVVDEISRKVPLAGDKIAQMAKSLALAGLRGKELRDMLETLAEVGSVSEEASGKLQALIEKMSALGHFDVNAKALKGTGISIQDVFKALSKNLGKSIPEIEALMKAGKISIEEGTRALQDAARAKFGPALEKQMLPLSVQFAKFKENLANLFEDIDIEPFLKGLQSVLSLFSESTSYGRALKTIVTGVFSGLFNAAAKVFPYVKAFLKGLISGFLYVYIALKPIGRLIGSIFGGTPSEALLTFFKILGYVVAAVAVVLGAVLAATFALVNVFVILGGAIWALIGYLVGLGAQLIGAVWGAISGTASALWDWAASAVQAGINFVQGLADGITNGASAVIGAALDVASGAIDAVKGALGISSPSKVMAEMGGHTASGFAEGLEGSAPTVKGAAEGMSSSAVSGAGKGAGAGGGASITIGDIIIQGVADAEGAKRGVLEALAEAFQPLGLEVGI
jgi:tape measure protein